MKAKLSLIVAFSIIWAASVSFGATLYVDNQLTNNCSTYNPDAGRGNAACGAGSSSAYVKIQDAINNMSIGDTIYIRGGTYHEVNSNTDSMIDIPTALNGDSWEEGHYNTLTSYPGEWAIIDGKGSAPKGIVLGHKYMSSGHTKYWKLERLGITGGCRKGDPAGGAGLWFAGGPLILRYCHIYENWDDDWSDNPSGVTTYRLGNSIIEYNYFYHNGQPGTNGDQLIFYTDYDDEAAGYTDLRDINEATRNNIVRYNLFDGGSGSHSEVGIKYKGSQLLTDTDKTDMTFKEFGDDIHHNIFLNHGNGSVMLRQDFIQFHHNILIGPNGDLQWGQRSTWRRWYGVFYNNTIIDSGYQCWFDDSTQPFEANEHQVNTIYAHYNAGSNAYSYPFLWWWDNSRHDPDNAIHEEVFDHNYIYAPISGDLFRVGMEITPHSDSHFGSFTTAEYNAENSVTNYQKASSEGSDNLFQGTTGEDQYITRGAHVVSGATTIANGGVGGSHPYLSGVALPSYLGATDPEDNAWVGGVLNNVSSISWLRAQGDDDPSWIAGSVDPIPDLAAPSNVTVVTVVN